MQQKSQFSYYVGIFLFTIFFNAKQTLASGSTNITSTAFGGIKDALPAAYGDFNSDELTDIFILTQRQKVVQILLGSADSDSLVS